MHSFIFMAAKTRAVIIWHEKSSLWLFEDRRHIREQSCSSQNQAKSLKVSVCVFLKRPVIAKTLAICLWSQLRAGRISLTNLSYVPDVLAWREPARRLINKNSITGLFLSQKKTQTETFKLFEIRHWWKGRSIRLWHPFAANKLFVPTEVWREITLPEYFYVVFCFVLISRQTYVNH